MYSCAYFIAWLKWSLPRTAQERASTTDEVSDFKECSHPSNTLLQSLHCKSLHNGVCCFCLDLNFLAECHALAGFSRWLVPGLDHANAWDRELAGTLRLLLRKLCQGIQDLSHLRPLLLACCRQSISNATLRHGLNTLLRPHCPHRLHGLHRFLCHFSKQLKGTKGCTK